MLTLTTKILIFKTNFDTFLAWKTKILTHFDHKTKTFDSF